MAKVLADIMEDRLAQGEPSAARWQVTSQDGKTRRVTAWAGPVAPGRTLVAPPTARPRAPIAPLHEEFDTLVKLCDVILHAQSCWTTLTGR